MGWKTKVWGSVWAPTMYQPMIITMITGFPLTIVTQGGSIITMVTGFPLTIVTHGGSIITMVTGFSPHYCDTWRVNHHHGNRVSPHYCDTWRVLNRTGTMVFEHMKQYICVWQVTGVSASNRMFAYFVNIIVQCLISNTFIISLNFLFRHTFQSSDWLLSFKYTVRIKKHWVYDWSRKLWELVFAQWL